MSLKFLRSEKTVGSSILFISSSVLAVVFGLFALYAKPNSLSSIKTMQYVPNNNVGLAYEKLGDYFDQRLAALERQNNSPVNRRKGDVKQFIADMRTQDFDKLDKLLATRDFCHVRQCYWVQQDIARSIVVLIRDERAVALARVNDVMQRSMSPAISPDDPIKRQQANAAMASAAISLVSLIVATTTLLYNMRKDRKAALKEAKSRSLQPTATAKAEAADSAP